MPQIDYDLPPPKWGSFPNHPNRTIIFSSPKWGPSGVTFAHHIFPDLSRFRFLFEMYLIVPFPLHSQCHHAPGLAQITNSLLPGSSASNLSPFPISSTDFGPTWFLKLLSPQQFLSPEAICLSHEIQILIASQAPEQPFPPLYPSVFLSVQFITSSPFRPGP